MQALPATGRLLSNSVESLKGLSESSSLRVSMSDSYVHVHLPRLRCPRGGGGGIRSPCRSDGLCPARTPRRRYGRLAAGAAVALFTPYLTSAIACQGFLYSSTNSSTFACWPLQRSLLRKGPPSGTGVRPRRRRSSKPSAGDRDGGDAVDWEEEETEDVLHDEDDEDDEARLNESKRVRGAAAERSESVVEELLLFFFQLDLGTRLQRALNQDQYDEAAQQLREKIAEVDREVARQRASKAGGGSEWPGKADQTLSALRVRSDLAKAVDEERYADAARLRDRLREFQAESLAITAQAFASNSVMFRFRLGQRVRHLLHDYRGVICGMDAVCYETEEWMKRAGVGKTERGRNQPFYHILGDMGEGTGFIVTYVAEDNLTIPRAPEREDFEHPYTYLLFYGKDKMGDYIPTKQLREKFNAPRYEVKEEDRIKPPAVVEDGDRHDGSNDGGERKGRRDGGGNEEGDSKTDDGSSSVSGSSSGM